MFVQGKTEVAGKKKKEMEGILAEGEKMLDEANALSDSINQGKEVSFMPNTRQKCYTSTSDVMSDRLVCVGAGGDGEGAGAAAR